MFCQFIVFAICAPRNMGEPECGWDFELSPTPRLRNRSTQHQPLVAHGCGGHGRWFLSDVYRELGLIDACFEGLH